MANIYKQFLASPNPSLLANNATLHYLTTTTSFAGAEEIMKHLGTLHKQVSMKKQHVLNLVDGGNSAAFEVDTTIEFQTSGGTYLPGLDDNFLSDHEVSFPIVSVLVASNAGDSRLLIDLDPFRLFRLGAKDFSDSHPVGPSLIAQTTQYHRPKRCQLAYTKRPRSAQVDCELFEVYWCCSNGRR